MDQYIPQVVGEVWILEADQGSYSDRCQWVVGLYHSPEDCFNDPQNQHLEFKSHPNADGYYAEEREDTAGNPHWDPIHYTLQKMPVYSHPKPKPEPLVEITTSPVEF